MAKIKLGSRPKSFKSTVKFPMLDGTEGAIDVNFRYRTRTEFGAFIDKIIADAGDVKPADDGKFSMEELMAKTAGSNADYVLAVIEGWNLDEELTAENVRQLADELPAATAAIMETYRTACTEGRRGN